MGSESRSAFNGSMMTHSKLHGIFGRDVSSEQRLSGLFDVDRVIEFHRNATLAGNASDCGGLDCH